MIRMEGVASRNGKTFKDWILCRVADEAEVGVKKILENVIGVESYRMTHKIVF